MINELRAQSARNQRASEGSDAAAREPESTILVADDDRLIVATIAGALRTAGFRVIEAFDCAAALEACISGSPSLALIDYKMPDSNGVELARQIAARTRVPVIFLSAYGDDAIVRQAVDAGAMSYLVKPLDPAQIIPVVRAALQRARELQAFQAQSDRLNVAVRTGKQIGIATGLLMANLNLDQKEAFERLRRQARSSRTRVEDLASKLLQLADEAGEFYRALIPNGTIRGPSEKDPGDS